MGQTFKTELENAADKSTGAIRRFAKKISGTAEDLAERVASSADSAIDTLGEKIGDAGESIGDRSTGRGFLERVGRILASSMKSVGTYLEEKDLRDMAMDVGGVIKRNPGKTILIGAGVGYLIARRMRK